MDLAPSPIPFPVNAARAYAQSAVRAPSNTNAQQPIATIGPKPATPTDTVELSGKGSVTDRAADMAARLKELVAARVERPADLPIELRDADIITQSLAVKADRADLGTTGTAATPIYRHPADQNAAATGVELGRRLDLSV